MLGKVCLSDPRRAPSSTAEAERHLSLCHCVCNASCFAQALTHDLFTVVPEGDTLVRPNCR